MSDARKKALEIIERWISKAHDGNMVEHKQAFWLIRDALEGRRLAGLYIQPLRDFLATKCKPSQDRDAIQKELEEVFNEWTSSTAK